MGRQKRGTGSWRCGWFAALIFICGSAVADPQVDAEINLAAGRAATGATGRGVLVAVIDRGLDYTHPDFRNADGSTRIRYIFDLTDDTGAANPYGMGTIYTRAQIDAALTSGTRLPTRDAVGHGTTTTGLCCGNGRASGGLYVGAAPEADLIVIKAVSEGAPAHGTEAAEAPYYVPARIPVALKFATDKAAEIGMPVVILANFGSNSGPGDGTSATGRAFDSTAGPGKAGIAIVSGVGDDGGQPNHAAGTIAPGATVDLAVTKAAAGTVRIDLWYTGAARLDVTLIGPGGVVLGTFAAPAGPQNSVVQDDAVLQVYHLGEGLTSNGQRELLVDLKGATTGSHVLRLTATGTQPAAFNAALNPSRIGSASSGNAFTSYVVPGSSMNDQSAARYNIAPNSYVFRTQWQDIDGITRTFTGEGTIGQLWRGSSVGPTWDGRTGVDFSAPGDRVVTTYAPNSYFGTFRSNLVAGGNGLYGITGAVSAAAPTVAGVVALMLQRIPTLDAPAIKGILQRTARRDAFTGSAPSAQWGYGKLDAGAALAEVERTRAAGPAGTAVAIEYYYATFDHYFMTIFPSDIDALDSGRIAGWTRTGATFKVYTEGSAQAALCRFFSTSFSPKSSHFYTPFPSECSTVRANPNWQFEAISGEVALPDATSGGCIVGTQPLYRLYNNGQGGAPNHRYTTSTTIRSTMLAAGWIPEGYGPLGVIACVPT